jgi:hypothetical protein
MLDVCCIENHPHGMKSAFDFAFGIASALALAACTNDTASTTQTSKTHLKTPPKLVRSSSLSAIKSGEEVRVCAGQIQPGWVILDVLTDYTACGGGSDNIWIIKNLNGMPLGSQVTCCGRSIVPAGWVVVGTSTDFTRCGRNAGSNNLRILKNVSGGSGQQIRVCAGQLPAGWVIMDVVTDLTACGGNSDNMWVIKNLNGMPLGSQVTCCARSTVPAGWVVVGTSTDFTRCGRNSGSNNLKVLRKVS